MSTESQWQGRLRVARWAISGGDNQAQPAGQAKLNLAVDSCYFAMYHAPCQSNSEVLAGGSRRRSPEDWLRV